MNILIADSGATKTDWRLLSDDAPIRQLSCQGLNPYQHTAESLHENIGKIAAQLSENPDKIYFYGAGCNPATSPQIEAVLAHYFSPTLLEVHNDLLAAARATCLHEQGIACILGTGSNSCYFDGKQIVANVASLGYVLADEGSGADLGKKLLTAYLRNELPEALQKSFEKRYQLSAAQILHSLYKEPFANRFLASFSSFIFHHLEHPYLYKMVYDCFISFFENNVVKYQNYQQYKVHFVGSIAYYYANILRKAASDLHLNVQHILESPIAGLSLYHQEK